MAAMFYLGSVILYVRARNAELGPGRGAPASAYAGSALLTVGAFFSKEDAASLPIAILLAELAFFPASGARAGSCGWPHSPSWSPDPGDVEALRPPSGTAAARRRLARHSRPDLVDARLRANRVGDVSSLDTCTPRHRHSALS